MIVKYPDNRLDQVSISALENLSISKINDLCKKMREECWKVNGLGISAIQIGEPYRIFGIINPNKKDLMWMIDPEIRRSSGKITYTEGCLSIPDFFWDVTRYEKVSVAYYDNECNKNYRTFNKIHARIIQHEMDHLDGLLIPDCLDDKRFGEFDNFYSSNRSPRDYKAPKINLI